MLDFPGVLHIYCTDCSVQIQLLSHVVQLGNDVCYLPANIARIIESYHPVLEPEVELEPVESVLRTLYLPPYHY